jgi:hypothetical protein
MKRQAFLARGCGIAAAVAAGVPLASSAAPGTTTLDALLAPMPPFAPGQWLQYAFESAPAYMKRIGFGLERTSAGVFRTIETQVGGTEYACDPNTIKKSYLSAASYGNLLQAHPVRFLTVKAGMSFMLSAGSAEDALWLLDTDTVDTPRPARIVERASETLRVHRKPVATERLTLRFAGSTRVTRLWLAAGIPGGVARLETSGGGQDPFAMRLNNHGEGYQTLVTESFEVLRKRLID